MYKVDSANKKAWATSITVGYSTKINNLVTDVSGSTGNLTFTGYIDGSTGLEELKKVVTDYSETNYPAWSWCQKYGTTNCSGTSFEAGWYFPSVAQSFSTFERKN